jgi:hypothetical protein
MSADAGDLAPCDTVQSGAFGQSAEVNPDQVRAGGGGTRFGVFEAIPIRGPASAPFSSLT